MNVNQYKNFVASLGCILCGESADLHHPRFACGMGMRSSDWLVIPLCKFHHQDGAYGQAIHNGQQEFEANHGTEQALLAQTIKQVFNHSLTLPF